MRNLILLQEQRRTLHHLNDTNIKNQPSLCQVTHDPNNTSSSPLDIPNESYLLLSSGELICYCNNIGEGEGEGEEEQIRWRCQLNDFCNTNENDNRHDWFHAVYMDEMESIVCLSRNGNILMVDPQNGVGDLVGCFENGIWAAEWSPDEEILMLYTCTDSGAIDGEEKNGGNMNHVLIAMNTSFEVITEINVEPALLPESYGTNSRNISMSWKPDGQHLVVSSIDASDSIRRVRIYHRDDLSLEGVGLSEDGSGRTVPGLLDAKVAWGGAHGGLIATAQASGLGKKRNKVFFFEPNGLNHGEFNLRDIIPKTDEITNLTWNSDRDLLAVTIARQSDTPSDDSNSSRVQLWYRNNYHWYMKYELFYNASCVSMTKFDIEKPYRLIVALHTMKDHTNDDNQNQIKYHVRTYDFCWDTNVSTQENDDAFSSIAVVDGRVLNLTPLAKALIPPPMCATSVTLDAPVIGVSYPPTISNKQICGNENGELVADGIANSEVFMMVHISNQNLVVFGSPLAKAVSAAGDKDIHSMTIADYATPPILSMVNLSTLVYNEQPVDSTTLRQLTIVNHDTETNVLLVLGVCCTTDSDHSLTDCECLIELEINVDTAAATIVNNIALEERVLRIVNWSNDVGRALVELIDGSLLEYNSALGGVVPPDGVEPMLEPCPWISVLNASDILSDDDESPHNDNDKGPLVVGLSLRSRLYCGELLLSSAASTYSLSKSHPFVSFVAMGSKSQLRFVPTSALLNWDPFGGGSDDLAQLFQEGYEPRLVERGSRIVSVFPTTPTIVIQLPRGNLEMIVPRALVLPFSMSLIQNKQYGEALLTMRKQKVDLNLIVDFDPCGFLEDIMLFLREVTKIDFLNLFLSSLCDLNVTLWKYPVPSWFPRAKVHTALKNKTFDFGNKVNVVCQAMRSAMMELEATGNVQEGHYLLPILSSFAKQTPPKLENALTLIQENASAAANNPPPPTKNGTKKAKKHNPLLSDKTQSSIQYLAFLADYDLLFDTALGMYDYELAKAVARNSQKDPKSYLPLLKKMSSLPNYMGRYEVDVTLKRWEYALKNLAMVTQEDWLEVMGENGGEHFDQCMQLVKEHNLHELGLTLFPNDGEQRRRIMISLGQRLLEERNGDAALTIFLAAEPRDLVGAKKAARMSGDWRTYFSCCSQENDADAETQKLIAYEIAEEVSVAGTSTNRRESIANGACILLDYCSDVEAAVDMLLTGELWEEAQRVARLHHQNLKIDLEQRCIQSAVYYAQSCLTDLDDRMEAFEKASLRYDKVIKIRQDAIRNGEVNDNNMQDDNGSLFSAASNASNTSLQSNMSGSSYSSVNSMSSVISANTASTFNITSSVDMNKHKSKFNQIGRNKKKKKKKSKKPKSKKMKAGSEEELKSLIITLKQNCISDDEEYLVGIGGTVSFLSRVGQEHVPLARDLFFKYEDFRVGVQTLQKERLIPKEEEDMERMDGAQEEEEVVLVGCEEEVNALCCGILPQVLHQTMLFLGSN